MSIIAIRGIPQKWNLRGTQTTLMKCRMLRGQCEVLNFANGRAGMKIAYIRISEKLDPQGVVESVNQLIVKNVKLFAFVPNHVPDLPLASKLKNNGKAKKQGKSKGKRQEKSGDGQGSEWILITSHKEIMEELMYKYTGIIELSKKTLHKLLDDLSVTVFARLKAIMIKQDENSENCFTLTRGYRKAHPHFADFQLILSTLHRAEDGGGVPRTQLQEAELASFDKAEHYAVNLPHKLVQKVSTQYGERVISKLCEHVDAFETEGAPQLPEDAARLRVRKELKALRTYLPHIVRQVIQNNFLPDDKPTMMMRIYGEPFLPPKDVILAQLKRFHPSAVSRSMRMYNLLRFNVPIAQSAHVRSLDGTVLAGSKLVVRQSTVFPFNVTRALINHMKGGAEDEDEATMDYDETEDAA